MRDGGGKELITLNMESSGFEPQPDESDHENYYVSNQSTPNIIGNAADIEEPTENVA